MRRRLPLPQAVVAIGLAMCLAPVASHLYLTHQAAENVSSMTSVAEAIDPAAREMMLEQAHAYNDILCGRAAGDAEGILPYEQQLSIDGTEAMCALEVPKAGIRMTVYHGVGEPALSMGIGHQPEFSLPVGGEGCHAVLSGHSGMRQCRIFDGIRALEPGDVFAVWVLAEPYAYRVTGWEIVDPAESGLALSPTGDRCTLVTCTTDPDPYNPKGRIGVNDRRLLVHAERCAYDPAEFADAAVQPDASVFVNDNTRPAIAAAALLLVFALILALGKVARKRGAGSRRADRPANA